MSDIIVHKFRDRAVCVPGTPKGVTWIRDQIRGGSVQYSVASDLADEVVDVMRKGGLEVDVR